MSTTKTSDRIALDQSKSLNRKKKSPTPVKLKREPEPVEETQDSTIEWDRSAFNQLDQTLDELREALKSHAQVLTRSRNSSCVTDAEIHDALKHLVSGLKQPRWVKTFRIIITTLVTLGGVVISTGATTDDPFLIFIGVCFTITLVGLQELLLHLKQ